MSTDNTLNAECALTRKLQIRANSCGFCGDATCSTGKVYGVINGWAAGVKWHPADIKFP